MTDLRKSQLQEVIDLNSEIHKCGINLSAVLNLTVERVCTILGACGAVIELKVQNALAYSAGAGTLLNNVGITVPLSKSLSSECLHSKSTLYTSDVEHDTRVDQTLCKQLGIQAMIVAPLFHNELAVGVLKAAWSHPHAFKKTDVKFLNLIAEQIGTSIYLCAKYSDDQLVKLATTDLLTELTSRSVFMATLRSYLSLEENSCAIIVIKLAGLKAINDEFGHSCGDAVLLETSRRLQICTKRDDIISRIRGDEFAVLMPRIASAEFKSILVRITKELHEEFSYRSLNLDLFSDIGFAVCPEDSSDPNDLLALATSRMN